MVQKWFPTGGKGRNCESREQKGRWLIATMASDRWLTSDIFGSHYCSLLLIGAHGCSSTAHGPPIVEPRRVRAPGRHDVNLVLDGGRVPPPGVGLDWRKGADRRDRAEEVFSRVGLSWLDVVDSGFLLSAFQISALSSLTGRIQHVGPARNRRRLWTGVPVNARLLHRKHREK